MPIREERHSFDQFIRREKVSITPATAGLFCRLDATLKPLFRK